MMLPHRITIQSKNVSRAANGEENIVWINSAVVWARVEQIRGREFFAAAQMQEAVDVRVTIRYRAGTVREQRILWRGVPLDIVSVIESGRHDFMELMCISGVRNANG